MHMFRSEIIREITVITLQIPSLDGSNAEQVTTKLKETIHGQTHTVVDLGALRYFDVSGFAAILKWAASSPQGTEVRLCSRSGTIHALLELLQAGKVVRLYQSREEAIESLRRAGPRPRKAVDSHGDRRPLSRSTRA
jgi:anti-anti-sigma factor